MEPNLRPLLLYTANQLQINSIPFWLDSGTLLGIVRDGHIIPFDFDIDFGVMEEECEKIGKLKDTFLIEKGYHLYTRNDYVSVKKNVWLNYDAYLHAPCVRIYDASHTYYLDMYWYRRLTPEQFDEIRDKNPSIKVTEGWEKKEKEEKEKEKEEKEKHGKRKRKENTKMFQTMAVKSESISTPVPVLEPLLITAPIPVPVPVPISMEEDEVEEIDTKTNEMSLAVSIPSVSISSLSSSTRSTGVDLNSNSDADWICNYDAYESNEPGGCRPYSATFPLSSLPFFSTFLPVPFSPSTHLDLMYGPSWRLPAPKGYKKFLCMWLPSKIVLVQAIVLVLCAMIGIGVREWRRKIRGEQRKREDGAQTAVELERIIEEGEEENQYEEMEDEEGKNQKEEIQVGQNVKGSNLGEAETSV